MPVHQCRPSLRLAAPRGLLGALAAGLLAAGCSSGGTLGSPGESMLGSNGKDQPTSPIATSAVGSQPQRSRTELDKAIEYWGAEHKKKPQDVTASLAYARNLKAAGHKEQAIGVLHNAALLHGDNKEIASELGRLALELDHVAVAENLLAIAEDPMKPDWRVTSARGTVLAKQGKYTEAIPFYDRALAIAPNQASVMNNLAMAHASNGDPVKGEEILRRAAAASRDPKIRQNLALVLGLQGKHDEAKAITANAADAEYIKRMVKPTQGQSIASADGPAQQAPAPAPAAVAASSRPAAKSGRPTDTRNARAVPAPQMRPASGPGDVAAPAGSWSTTVAVEARR